MYFLSVVHQKLTLSVSFCVNQDFMNFRKMYSNLINWGEGYPLKFRKYNQNKFS